jgi:hypothetical protein
MSPTSSTAVDKHASPFVFTGENTPEAGGFPFARSRYRLWKSLWRNGSLYWRDALDRALILLRHLS